MGHLEPLDPAWALNRRAQAEGWPFQCDTALRFERPELNALIDIWRTFAAGRPAPQRSDFDARTLKPYLRNISILERVYLDHSTWRYRLRLTGTAVTGYAGSQKYEYLDQQIPPEFLSSWTSCHDAVLDSGMPMRFDCQFRLPQLEFLRGEALIAPLADTRGALTLAFSCLYLMPRL